MDAVITVVSVVSVLAGVVLAYVLYTLIRMALAYFRETASDKALERYRLLRLSDRAIGVICAVCFVALVL